MASSQRGLHHIGYWTDDLDAAMAQATRLLGVGPFQVLEHVNLGDFRFRGEPATLDHSAAFASWGPVLLELDQVHEVQPAALREALGVRPGTVSHVAWTTGDLGAEREHLTAAGCGLLTTSVGGAVADWFSCALVRAPGGNPPAQCTRPGLLGLRQGRGLTAPTHRNTFLMLITPVAGSVNSTTAFSMAAHTASRPASWAARVPPAELSSPRQASARLS